MKIIFLDIDGVLNVYCQGRDQYGCTFHKHFEDNLRYIIEQTGAKIVISSTWRMDGLQKMQQMWKDRKLAGEIIGITPTVADIVEKGTFEFYDQVERGHEIQQWIDEHIDQVENYCIIDDDNDMLQSQRNNFVRTANNRDHEDCVDVGYGLTRKCSEKVVQILNKIEQKNS
ncbi:MAG: HAD domain-containing protein [Candidatus Izemoplasmatales bacterium]